MLRQGSLISRVTALAILALVLLAGYRFLVMPLMQRLTANEQQIVHKSKLLQQYLALDAKRPVLADRLTGIQSRGHVVSGYWVGASTVLTAAKLQDRVSQSVETIGGNMISVQALASSDVEETLGTQVTRLNARFAATLDGLATILHDMESTTPYMFIDQLTVTSIRSRRNYSINEATDQEPKLDVRLGVFGYVRNNDQPQIVVAPLGRTTR